MTDPTGTNSKDLHQQGRGCIEEDYREVVMRRLGVCLSIFLACVSQRAPAQDYAVGSGAMPPPSLSSESENAATFDARFSEPLAPMHPRPADVEPSIFDEFTFFGGIDGSKQPQDFGVNANLGIQSQFNWGLPISRRLGLGLQLGSAIVMSENAVRVYELLGEATDRDQWFTTLGIFQRTESGWSWALAYDFLREKSFDTASLGQWRARVAYDLNETNQVGVTGQFDDRDDQAIFGAATPVRLKPITQGSFFWRHIWESSTQTTCWLGMAEGHGENNAVTGPSPAKDNVFVFGADILAPLNPNWAIYGETNLMSPADTGTVDAFLGLMWYPNCGAYRARQGQFAPVLPTAAPTSFSVDLR